MRRQTQSPGLAARWQPVPLDVNPFQLPARYVVSVRHEPGQASADWDHVIIQPGSVSIERSAGGVGQARVDYAIDAFSGVAIRMDSLDGTPEGLAVSVNLHHDDPDLCVPLHMAFDMNDAGARWQSWGKALGLPLLLSADDGSWREPIERLGKVTVDRPYDRDRRFWLSTRRSASASVRRMGKTAIPKPIAPQEIIARH